MPRDAIMSYGTWLYDEVPHEQYDCNTLATKQKLNPVEKQILKACGAYLERQKAQFN